MTQEKSGRILTGDRPTGPLHIGHYFGSLADRVRLQHEYETFLLIADVQALTDHSDEPEKVRDSVLDVALDYLAVGIDPERSAIVVQSQVPAIAELTVLFMNLVSLARVGRNPTVKDEVAQKRAGGRKHFGHSVPFGFFAYPVSQAADILAFNAALVPVGEDQLPMIELAREIARTFNRLYGEVFTEPEALVGAAARLPGLDGGAKMGKSLDNAIYLKDAPGEIKRKALLAFTDPLKIRARDPGRPGQCVVFTYHTLFAPECAEGIRAECLTGGRGCVLCKNELAASMESFLAPIREKRASLEKDIDFVKDVIREGTVAGRALTDDVLCRAKQAMQIDYGDIFPHARIRGGE